MGRQKPPLKSLSKGRPPLAKKLISALSSKTTRTIIRKHHNLLKAQAQAVKAGDSTAAEALEAEITANGGLERYQKASQIGQLTSRGGDTSRVLRTWLEEDGVLGSAERTLTVLEIGCLEVKNEISKCEGVEMTRIDLHSSEPAILEQDFMARPLPETGAEKFDIISLSLVLNYVASPNDRWDMLFRTTPFLREQEVESLPTLFLVLPQPCVKNSRHMTTEHLKEIMASLGYELKHSKITTKIFYSLWSFDMSRQKMRPFKKVEIAPGKSRNNFSIVFSKPL